MLPSEIMELMERAEKIVIINDNAVRHDDSLLKKSISTASEQQKLFRLTRQPLFPSRISTRPNQRTFDRWRSDSPLLQKSKAGSLVTKAHAGLSPPIKPARIILPDDEPLKL